MLVFGTEMHIVTFIFVALESIMFIFQLVFWNTFLHQYKSHNFSTEQDFVKLVKTAPDSQN